MSFPAYPEYKDSGVEWLGQVPSHWSVVQVRRLFRLINGATPPSGYDEYWGGDITWVTPEDLSKIEANQICASKRTLSEQGYRACGFQLIQAGSIAVSIRAPVGYVAIAGVPLCVNQGCRGLVPSRDIDSRFYMYWILACREILQSLSGGSTFQELSSNVLAAVPTVWPSSDEQEKIATFLDYETARIDALIEEQQRLIELLKEKRQAVISHAVTKGLDPDVPMKDSGVEWLGEVPAHWELVPLSRVLNSIEQGWSPSADSDPALLREWGVIKLSAIRSGFFVEEKNKRLPEGFSPRLDLEIKAGDLLITRANTPELVGDACVVREQPAARLIFSDLVYRLRASESIDPLFLCYCLISDVGRVQFQIHARGSSMSMAKISHEHIKQCMISLPPLDEQRRIVSIIDEHLARISELSSAGRKTVELLEERRSALISAAVTGKIDVRDWTPPASSTEAEHEGVGAVT
ncbi:MULTISPECIES: restriction endonuclease subunit S [unclassified Halorhodospira]|uniref:restriction endonuclease subunit S n=1 Tax=unclassified Halorhodospira TaxID=2626748 RepID=UPI001EE7D955|nr:MULTISPECIES: restriction endonuclease subunit S [unclassified Halorhodospira]MCG5541613.1 restriction endonuclease subunit S [Halorhodospira sp. M39old]MCG5544676.1 restriction endonuclease subunit S [Halorhodospira sp. M38]